jgi:hypothetical protein
MVESDTVGVDMDVSEHFINEVVDGCLVHAYNSAKPFHQGGCRCVSGACI